MSPSSPRRSWTAKLVTSLLSLLVAFAGAEIGLRTYQLLVRGVPFFSLLPGYREARFARNPFLAFGPRADWQLPGKRQPEHAYFNAQGLRTPEWVGPKAPGEYRILALGGSTTENVWNEEGIHWPLVLERELHARARRDVRVLNAGMSAYSTAHSLVRLALDLIELQPDLVIVLHNINDLSVSYYAARENTAVDPSYRVKYGQKPFTGVIDDGDVVLSRVWHSVRTRLAPAPEPAPFRPADYDLQPGLRLFARNLREIAAIAPEGGSRVLLLTMPILRDREVFERTRELGASGHLGPVPGYERFLGDFDAYNAAILQVGADAQIPTIDMAALLGQDGAYFVDIVHYSDAGIREFGRVLAEQLLAAGILDPAPPPP